MNWWGIIGFALGWAFAPVIYLYGFTYVRRMYRWARWGRCPYSQGGGPEQRCLLGDKHWERGDPDHKWSHR